MCASSNKIWVLFVSFLCLASYAFAGERIYYSHLTDGYWQIWQMNTDGSQKKQITQSSFDKRDTDWFNGGKSIGYRTSNGQLYINNNQGSDEREILPDYTAINNPHFSKTKEQVVFVRFDPRYQDKGQIWVSDFNAVNTKVLTREQALNYQPSFSPDGDYIVYVKASTKNKAHHLWMMEMATGKNKQLTFGEHGFDNLASFSPDGKTILYTSNRLDDNYEIYLLDIESLELTRLTQNAFLDTHPSFSPDGKSIVFVSDRSGHQHLYKMDIKTQALTILTEGEEEYIDPVWVPIKGEQ